MNPDTGRMYYSPKEAQAAIDQGFEKAKDLLWGEAEVVGRTSMRIKQAKRIARNQAKAKRRMQKASRKCNR